MARGLLTWQNEASGIWKLWWVFVVNGREVRRCVVGMVRQSALTDEVKGWRVDEQGRKLVRVGGKWEEDEGAMREVEAQVKMVLELVEVKLVESLRMAY